jgi:hypothetical protein
MLRALEQIRRMRGGAQSHLMRCSDGFYYVVKIQNNLLQLRMLVNGLLGTKQAARMGLPTVSVAIEVIRRRRTPLNVPWMPGQITSPSFPGCEPLLLRHL